MAVLSALTCMFMVLSPVGCGGQQKDPVAYHGPTLARHDLGFPDSPTEPTGFGLIEQTSPSSRFPTALAVALLEPACPPFSQVDPEEEPREGWRVANPDREAAVQWNALFDTIPAVREVIVMDRLSVPTPAARPEEAAASAARLQAGLCLVYGPTEAGSNGAAFAGLLLDTANRQRIAWIRAEAWPADFGLPPNDRLKQDLRYRDVNYLALRRFQAQVRRCLLSLIEHDAPATDLQDSPWKSPTTRPGGAPIYILPEPMVP
jgi:hypothetical protein